MTAADPQLEVACRLSEEILTAADLGEMFVLTQLDAQRRELLESFRRRIDRVEPADHRLLNEIAMLNERTLGAIEHQRRAKAREMDMAAVGRRAVNAYASTSSR